MAIIIQYPYYPSNFRSELFHICQKKIYLNTRKTTKKVMDLQGIEPWTIPKQADAKGILY